jgi:endonuclease G
MERLVTILVLVVGLTWPSLTIAQVSAEDHCLKGCPTGTPAANTLVERTIYALSNNPLTKFADWVAYKVTASNLSGPSRGRNWATAPDLNSADTLSPPEYDHSNVTLGVDRGHQAPLAAFKGHADWRMTNYLSNITPQSSKLNQGPWKNLEAAVRKLAQTGVDVWVMTGPLYEWPMAKLPGTDKRHQVPSSYWKVVAVEEGTAMKVAGFYFYQDTPRRANYCDHMKTVDFIEAKSGLNFFTGFSGEAALESSQPTLKTDLSCP